MMTQTIRSRREEYSDETRKALIEAAKDLFGAAGYHDTGVEAIARAARVTRGALYHHFADKRALFDAVVVVMQADVAEHVETRARGHEDRWTRMRAGFAAYLGACLDPAFRRMVIQEAPTVLGMERFLEIDGENARRLLISPIASMNSAGILDVSDVYLLGRLISAMMREAAQLMHETADTDRLRESAIEVVMQLLQTYRRT